MRTVLLSLFFYLFWFPMVAYSAELQPHTSIIQQAQSWLETHSKTLGEETTVKIQAPDPRIRLAHCETTLSVFIANGSIRPGPQTVGVRCPQDTPWTLYLSSYVRVYTDIAIARHSIPRGQVIQTSDIEMKRMDVSTLKQDYLTSLKHELGKITRRTIREGQVISGRLLVEKKLIQRGDTVQIVASSQKFSIRMTGIAMEHGRLGERINVRNVQSKRIVEGLVTREGIVRVSL